MSTFDKTASYYGLGITLGNAEVRLADLVAAYSAFARGGVLLQPRAVRAVDAGDGPVNVSRSAGPRTSAPTRLMSTRSAFWITDILSDPAAREFVFGRGGSLDFPFPVAVKTGTSQGYHDNWTIGYTREVTVGVWVGNFDRSPLTNSSGVTGAGPIFHGVMLAAQRRSVGRFHDGSELTQVPDGIVRQPICAISGMRATAACPMRINEWLPAVDAGLPCSWHHDSDEGPLVVWPAVYRQWAQAHHLLADARKPGPGALFSQVASKKGLPDPFSDPLANRRRFAIANPPAGAVYLIDPTLRSEFQTLPLSAVADRDAGEVAWSIDGRSVGQSAPDASLAWPLSSGRHRVEARDEIGRSATTNILVK